MSIGVLKYSLTANAKILVEYNKCGNKHVT